MAGETRRRNRRTRVQNDRELEARRSLVRAVAAGTDEGLGLSWLLQDHQLPIYRLMADRRHQTVALNVSRQTGKSTVAVVFAVEECLRRPDIYVQFVAPRAKQMGGIVKKRMRWVLDSFPEDLRPVPSVSDSCWTFPNGSVLQFDGANSEQADSMRGRSADLVVIDEARDIDDLRYLIHDVIRPMFIVTKGRLIVISTPAKVPGHYLGRVFAQAEAEGAYLRMTVHDNTFLTPQEVVRLCEQEGGEDSPTWRREYLVEAVPDLSLLALPEAIQLRGSFVGPVEPPTRELRWVSADWGVRDPNSALLGYWDFRRSRLVVQRELFMPGLRTDELAAAIRGAERELWGDTEPAVRIGDIQLQTLKDMTEGHGLRFQQVTKQRKEAMVSELRVWLSSGRVAIDPACVRLVEQLTTVVWNNKRDAFVRMDGHHFDLVDALVYMVVSSDRVRHTNPFPRFDGLDMTNRWLRPQDRLDDDETASELRKLWLSVGTDRGWVR